MCSLLNQSGKTCSLHRLHFFPRLEPVTSFPAWGTCCMLSRAWNRLHLFPLGVLVACFPALFQHLAHFAYFPALGRGYIFQAWHLYIFLRLVQQYIFSCSLPFYDFLHFAPVAYFGLLSSERSVVIIYIFGFATVVRSRSIVAESRLMKPNKTFKILTK